MIFGFEGNRTETARICRFLPGFSFYSIFLQQTAASLTLYTCTVKFIRQQAVEYRNVLAGEIVVPGEACYEA